MGQLLHVNRVFSHISHDFTMIFPCFARDYDHDFPSHFIHRRFWLQPKPQGPKPPGPRRAGIPWWPLHRHQPQPSKPTAGWPPEPLGMGGERASDDPMTASRKTSQSTHPMMC